MLQGGGEGVGCSGSGDAARPWCGSRRRGVDDGKDEGQSIVDV